MHGGNRYGDGIQEKNEASQKIQKGQEGEGGAGFGRVYLARWGEMAESVALSAISVSVSVKPSKSLCFSDTQ